jgi:hypothetical protein
LKGVDIWNLDNRYDITAAAAASVQFESFASFAVAGPSGSDYASS